MDFSTVSQALGAWYRTPLSKLPRELRPVAEAYIPKWADLTPIQRKERAGEIDRQRDLKTSIKLNRSCRQQKQDEANADPMEIEAGYHIGYYKKQHVQTWLMMRAVSPQDAALLFFGENPSKYKGSLPYMGEDFDLMKLSFEDAARDGLARNLRDWVSVARDRNLQAVCIDGWEACITVAAPDAPTQTDTKPQAAPREAVDSSDATGWSLAIPTRYPGYRKQLFDLLKARHAAGQTCPTARDVLDTWKMAMPYAVTEVMGDSLKYEDTKGNTQTADLKAIQQAIKGLTK